MAKINLQSRSVFIISQAGCLLPLLILFNLFFGWLFLKPLHWLLIEAALVALFIANAAIFTRYINSAMKKRSNVVDVEAKVIEDREKLK